MEPKQFNGRPDGQSELRRAHATAERGRCLIPEPAPTPDAGDTCFCGELLVNGRPPLPGVDIQGPFEISSDLAACLAAELESRGAWPLRKNRSRACSARGDMFARRRAGFSCRLGSPAF
mmetsp:Transcript_92000/g.259928  ORF Transcript_92000/g.259928 Transcript_92000/m.259928 type:complete len:119 (-) Transcript_92000:40-396(-)